MRIAIHDAEADHFGTYDKFPNLALMRISAWHKAQGDEVEWFSPIMVNTYDKVYSSKVFDFTPESDYLPPDTIKGGTGYGIYDELPPQIEATPPDYSIYPFCDYAIGFITRGCPNNCPWCYVPRKEGKVRPYARWTDIVREDSDKLVLMDNNILAHPHGIDQLREIAETKYKIDINQAMDVFRVTEDLVELFGRLKWISYIRFAVDRKAQVPQMLKVAKMFREAGIPTSRILAYCLITDDIEDDLARIYAMREAGIQLYGMPYVDATKGVYPHRWQKVMAQKYLYSGAWKKQDWQDWCIAHPQYNIND